ncbi:ribonuclease H2, subunit C [Lentinula novae-zelandiae]|nr:ribonuclease H2, subunit C [Lentinula novae-zelandiae]
MVSSPKPPTQKRYSRISIAPATSKALPQCTPYLMPFHIDYTGPAPVSTYFRVEDAKTHVGSPELSKDDSHTEAARASIGSSSSSLDVAQSPHEENDTISSIEQKTKSPEISTSNPVLDGQPRFISSFRGRTVQGLEVDLPAGYTGIVFRSGDEAGEAKNTGKGKGVANGKGRVGAVRQDQRRTTRRSTRSRAVDGDEVMDTDAEDEAEEASESALNLFASSQFKSFLLWHPDIPVDTGKDEYMSSIGEWIKIASVLHQVPPSVVT